ncbi:MAG: dephospho-CoA kinase [Rugosibacter sp.]
MSYIVGLTGGIGSGKSAVADLFAAQGARIIDADVIAHTLTAPQGAAMPAIRAAFGAAMITAEGALDRAAMRARVFAEPQERQRLEAILHPLIRAETDRQVAASLGLAPYAVLVIPLLVESGTYRGRVDRIAVVDCPEATQISRVMARNGLPRQEIERIMQTQATRAQRLAVADDLIDNGGGLAALAPQVLRLHRKYLELAGDAG